MKYIISDGAFLRLITGMLLNDNQIFLALLILHENIAATFIIILFDWTGH